MMQNCDEEYYRYMPSMRPRQGPCGMVFDDVDHSTICPHEVLPPKRDLMELAAEHGIELPPGM